MAEAEQKTYRIRRAYNAWFVRIYEGFSLTADKHLEDMGPYSFEEANQVAISLDIADGDKGSEQAHVRGFNATR